MKKSIRSSFNSGRWTELIRSAFLTLKNHNRENLVFQHLPVKGNLITRMKTNRTEEVNRMRIGIITDTLKIVDRLKNLNVVVSFLRFLNDFSVIT